MPIIPAAQSSRLVPSRRAHPMLGCTASGSRDSNSTRPSTPLGLTRNGDLYYTAFQSNVRIDVVKSRDDGHSWRIVSPDLGGRNAHLLSFDPYLYVDKDTSRVFNIDLTIACSYLSFTDGKGWTTNPLACGRPVNDHQTLFSGPPATSTRSDIPTSSTTAGTTSAAHRAASHSTGASPSFQRALPRTPESIPRTTTPVSRECRVCAGLHGHGFVAHDGTVPAA